MEVNKLLSCLKAIFLPLDKAGRVVFSLDAKITNKLLVEMYRHESGINLIFKKSDYPLKCYVFLSIDLLHMHIHTLTTGAQQVM